MLCLKGMSGLSLWVRRLRESSAKNSVDVRRLSRSVRSSSASCSQSASVRTASKRLGGAICAPRPMTCVGGWLEGGMASSGLRDAGLLIRACFKTRLGKGDSPILLGGTRKIGTVPAGVLKQPLKQKLRVAGVERSEPPV